MRPGCTLHPLITGVSLYRLPMPWRFKIKKEKSVQSEVDDLIEAGARHIEIVGDLISFTPEFMRAFEKKDMKYLKHLKGQGITFSVHLNHIGYSFPTHYKEMRGSVVAQFQAFVRYYESLEPIHYTLHPGDDELFKGQDFKDLPTRKTPSLTKFKMIEHGMKPLVIQQLLKNAPHAFKRLREIIGVKDLSRICIENPEGMSMNQYNDLFGPLSKMVPELGSLLDVGHLHVEEYLKNKNCAEDFVDYWGGAKKKLKAVHVHDTIISFNNKELIAEALDYAKQVNNDLERVTASKNKKIDLVVNKLEEFLKLNENQKPILTCHQKLGTGILNLQSLLRKLKQADFHGPVIFEAGDPNTTLDSVKLLTEEIEEIKKEK